MRRAIAIAVVSSAIVCAAVAASMTPKADGRLKGAFRRPAVNGWTFLGILLDGGKRGWIEPELAFQKLLEQTNFRAAPKLREDFAERCHQFRRGK